MILVTGANGLVGKSLLQSLKATGKKLRALYHFDYDKNIIDVEWVKGDILDYENLYKIFDGIEEVYHCAAYVSFNPKDKEKLFLVNVEGTANIVNICLEKQIRKLVYVSSVAALRGNEATHITEEMNFKQGGGYHSAYGKSKYYAELEVWRGISEGLSAVIVNPTIILGMGNWQQSSAAIFRKTIRNFPFYTTGINGFIAVEDVVLAMQLLMKSNIEGERFILVGENLSYKRLLDQIATGFNKKKPQIKINSFWAKKLAWAESIKCFLTAATPFITKETAHTATTEYCYTNQKFLDFFPDFKFASMDKVIPKYCAYYKNLPQ